MYWQHPFLLIAIAILVLIILWGLFLALPIMRAMRIDALLFADTKPYEQHPPNPSMHILLMGDSTAVGTGSVDSRESIAGRLGQQFPNADIENISQNGLKLAGLNQLTATAERNHYDLIVLQIGANDIIGFTPLSSIRTNVQMLFLWAHTHAARVAVLTAGNVGAAPIFLWPLSVLITQRTLEVRTIFMQEAALYSNLTYVDLFKDSVDEPFSHNIPYYYAPDHFHPSGAGYGLWYAQLQTALIE